MLPAPCENPCGGAQLGANFVRILIWQCLACLLVAQCGRQWKRSELLTSDPCLIVWVLVCEFLWGKRKRRNVWLVWRNRGSQQTSVSLVWGYSKGSHTETQQQNPVKQPQFWKQGCKQRNTASSGNLWHYNYLLSLHTHLSRAFQAEACWEGQEGWAPFSALPAACTVVTNALVTGTGGVERRGSLISSGFCVHIQQCHPREGMGRGGCCVSTTWSHIQHLLHVHSRESRLYLINLHTAFHYI